VTPAVVAPGLASVPVMGGDTEEDALVAHGAHETSDKHPAKSAAMLSTPPVQMWESPRSLDTSQRLSVMPKEDGASGVLQIYTILPYDMLDRT
jgi:hypothetical protein